MNKKLVTAILSTLLMTGFASAQEQTTTPAAAAPETTTVAAPAAAPTKACAPDGSCCKKPDAACSKADAACCKKNSLKKSCQACLTKDERHRFCCAKAAAIAANPALAAPGKKNKQALCDAICKQDPSMKPIMDKLKKHCEEMHKKMEQQPPATPTN